MKYENIDTYSGVSLYVSNLFTLLNMNFFRDEPLPFPVVTIQSNLNSLCQFYPRSDAWENEAETFYEFNVSAELMSASTVSICQEMLHQMVHFSNYLNGVIDHSRGGFYHNKKFRTEAERHGLKVLFDAEHGWSNIFPDEDLLAFIAEYELPRISLKKNSYFALPEHMTIPPEKKGGVQKRRKSSTRKYQCPECGISVRATKEVNIICGDCMEQMIQIDSKGEMVF